MIKGRRTPYNLDPQEGQYLKSASSGRLQAGHCRGLWGASGVILAWNPTA